jgi:hypothetical protein
MSRYSPTGTDIAAVRTLLGRSPAGSFLVLLRRPDGSPALIENAPHLEDGTPMPTLYWLVDPSLREQVSRIESEGGVHRYELEVDPSALDAAHSEYRALRESRVVSPELPQPSGGVGGTRRGVKCLHAHLAAYLGGIDDPVGALVASQVELGELLAEGESVEWKVAR